MYYPTRFNRCAGFGWIPKNYKRSTHRWVALSRNLLVKWGGEFKYGDTIVVQGIAEGTDGIYYVGDTMNKRFSNYIDILVSRDDTLKGRWRNVKISKYHEDTFKSEHTQRRRL